MINKQKNGNIPPLLENRLFVTNIEAKTNIFNKFFVQICPEASTSSTLPSFRPRNQILLEQFTITGEGIRQLIRSLYRKRALFMLL